MIGSFHRKNYHPTLIIFGFIVIIQNRDGQTDRQTERQTNRQTERQTDIHRQKDKTDGRTPRQMLTYPSREVGDV